MPLFPELGPQYYDEKDKSILSRMEAFYADSITLNQSFWTEADIDTRFEAGDQSVINDVYGNLPLNRKKNFNFNRIRRIINMIGGYQRRNRKSTIVVPIENGDQETADQFSKILMWINKQEGVLETVSESFHGAIVTGMNLLQIWVDYRSDPVSGNIRVDNCSYNSFLIDPFFKKPDLSDCNALWKRSYLTKRECISLLPDQVEMIENLTGNMNEGYDGKFQYMPQNYHFGPRNLMTYDEYYYRDYRTQKMLVDSQTGETQEWRGKDDERLNQFLRMYPQVSVIDQEIPTVKLAIVVQGKVLYNGQNPLGIDKYPFVPVFGYYTPQLPYFDLRIQGVVRGLRDAQYLYNRRKVIELDILESQINSGIKYKENALVDPKDAFLSGQGRGLAIKEEAQMSDVEQIFPPQIPPSMFQLSESLGREIQEISGVNEELLGSATDDKAGILSMLRQGAGLTTLQRLFDCLDQSQKLLGSLMVDIVQSNFTSGKVKRILEQEPTQQFYNKTFGTYDAAIEEGLNTSTQRQMQFAQLLHLKEVGIPIPDDVLIGAATIQNKKDLIDAIEQQKKSQQQLLQQQQQAALQEQVARTKLTEARTIADTGLGMERFSRIQENEALAIERKAQAKKDEEQALLNMIKALKEIEMVDLGQLQKLIALSRIVSVQGQEAEEQPVVRGLQTLQH